MPKVRAWSTLHPHLRAVVAENGLFVGERFVDGIWTVVTPGYLCPRVALADAIQRAEITR